MMPMPMPPAEPAAEPVPSPEPEGTPDKGAVEQQIRTLLVQVKKLADKSGVDFERILAEFSNMSGRKRVQIPPAKTIQEPRPR